MTPGIHLGQGITNILVEPNKGALSTRSDRSVRGQRMNHLISEVYGKASTSSSKTPKERVT